LRLRRRAREPKPGKRSPERNRHKPFHTIHPSLIPGHTVSDWSAKVNSRKTMRARGTASFLSHDPFRKTGSHLSGIMR
jgi:hypothetical protein